MPLAGMQIGDVGLAELAEVEAIMARAFDPVYGEAWSPAQCLAVLALPGYAIRIAASESGIVGFAIIRWVADDSELLLLAVDPDQRGRGVGAALIADWLAFAGSKGAQRFFLEMRKDNPAALLYARMGFAMCGERRGYYRGGDGQVRDAVTMQRFIG
jgi:[ribosomal protein S18]-alanine N-acetyltransferase